MNEMVLSTGKSSGLNIGGNALPNHNRLKNLDFESSGHTGFQKELTKKQLESLAEVSGKEDKVNKIGEWKEEYTGEEYPSAKLAHEGIERANVMAADAEDVAYMVAFDVYDYENGRMAQDYQKKWDKVTKLTEDVTDEQYPSAKAAFDGIQNKTAWEQIKAETLAEGVNQIELNLPEGYKELYWAFTVPTQNPSGASGFSPARLYLYGNNKLIADDQAWQMTDSVNPWLLRYRVQSFGNYCAVDKVFHPNAVRIDDEAYVMYHANSGYRIGMQPGKNIGADNITLIKLVMTSQTSGVRYFPAGTTYELWGVKA